MDLASYILEYFHTLDSALDELSNHSESTTSNLPPWVLSAREIRIGITPDDKGVILKVIPNIDLDSDNSTTKILSSERELSDFLAPWEVSFSLKDISRHPFMMVGGFVVETNNPLDAPIVDDSTLTGFGDIQGFTKIFSKESAKDEAINLWNRAFLGVRKSQSFIREVQTIFQRFRTLIKRKAFVERRIHRFINSHAMLLLPSFRRKFFEHKIIYGEDHRKADFILERETGFPPLLIELESPAHNLFTKKGDFTAEVNHAKGQITQWVEFIDRAPNFNASGDFAFLSGPKQRLIIIGRGLEHKERLISAKLTDTTIWTYELLLEHAKERLNNQIAEQRKILGLKELRPF